MQHFDSNYMEGAHPLILQRLIETNMEKTPGYGSDYFCESAKDKIRNACNCIDAEAGGHKVLALPQKTGKTICLDYSSPNIDKNLCWSIAYSCDW